MEELSFEQGVFIYSENLESDFMVASLQALLEISSNIKITSVDCNERIGGFKVCFGDLEARSVLEKGHLMVKDRKVSVYPLGTYLLVHDIHSIENAEIERDLTETVREKFGQVLHLQKWTDHPTEKTLSSYLVLIDIPEIKSSSIFSRNGYPRMSMAIPSMCKTYKVTFWCRRCKDHGHSLQECIEMSQNSIHEKSSGKIGSRHQNKTEIRSSSKKSSDNAAELYSDIRMDATRVFQVGKNADENPEVFDLFESTDIFANKLGRELVGNYPASAQTVQTDPLPLVSRVAESHISDINEYKRVNECLYQKYKRNKLAANTSIRKHSMSHTESPDMTDSTSRQGNATGRSLVFDETTATTVEQQVEDNNSQFKTKVNDRSRSKDQREPERTPERLQHNDDSYPFPSDATSTTNADDEMHIMDDHPSVTDVYQQNREESSKEATSYGNKKEPLRTAHLAENLSVNPHASNFTPTRHQSGPSTSSSSSASAHPVTDDLSELLQTGINNACVHGILDLTRLNAFFCHTKKKSNPSRIALRFTESTQGLKEQLNHILSFYYNSTQTFTKKDMEFIKWLSGVVERYEGTVPKKRKSGGKSSDASPEEK